MPRATITICVDDAGEVSAAGAWFDRWGTSLARKSQNYGCGCCVNIYDVEAPQEAIEAIPERMRSSSKWVETGERFGG